jgi:GT2 family glycosyltransferase
VRETFRSRSADTAPACLYMKRVSIIIPNYNGEELLAKHMPSVIAAFKNETNSILEIIIVDDASRDRSIALIKKFFPEVKLYRHKVNRGFSSTVNTGVRYAKGELVCLLNTDVSPKNNFLNSVFSHFDAMDTFAVTLHEKGYGWARGFFKNGFLEHKSGKETKKSHTSFWASGGSAVFNRKKWWELGGLDEKNLSPYYWEDVDIGYRAQKRGWSIWWEPKAHVNHEHEGTTSKIAAVTKQRIKERNQLIVIWKNITSKSLFRKHILGLVSRVAKHPGYIRIVIMALKNFPSIYKARMKEKKESKVSDEAIFARFSRS